jgi:Leucine-rich repeat (LRR) protein
MKIILGYTLILTVLKLFNGQNFNGLLTSNQLVAWGYNSATTTDLDLTGRGITQIQPGAFQSFINLQTLDLDDNNIETVFANTFTGLTNLKLLKLSNNQVKTIEIGAFNGLNNLEELDFMYNQIDSIKPGQFQGLDSVTTLLLYFNHIELIEPNTFCNVMPNLWHLALGGNYLKSITPDSLRCLTELEILDAWSNQISEIEDFSFNETPNLTKLDIDHNLLTQIEPNTFDGVNLHVLFMQYNPLKIIASRTFAGMGELVYLFLGSNEIEFIDRNEFRPLTSLVYLHLSNNQLQFLDRNFVQGITY